MPPIHHSDVPDTIITPRVVMRRPEPADARAVFTNWSGDPDVVRFLPWRRHESEADAAAYLESLAALWTQGKAYTWMITQPPRDESLGLAMVKVRASEAELGFSLARCLWGQGYMTEIATTLLTRAFANDAVERVVAVMDAENVASARVVEKIGMVRVDLFTDLAHPNISETPRPCYRYAIHRDQWHEPPPS